jgi:hypothetical protein
MSVPLVVTLRYFDGCPNWKIADQRTHDALRDTGLADSVSVTYEKVETPEQAERLGFIGSPTILIDGVDPWDPGGGPTGLSCRIYRTEDGPQGSPTVDQLIKAIAPV